ncbi:YfaZ family outer membrane protein, partial [Enterococcus faecalis]|uniref:YfaZ family outer membrane protein n=1 Tax=Enterococcus faecalis TaxID=1351 RepID=UPI003D6B7DF9
MTFSSQWAHSDNDGDSVGLGMGYNFNLGPFLMTLGGKAVYLNPKDGDEGYAIAAGDVRSANSDTNLKLFVYRHISNDRSKAVA